LETSVSSRSLSIDDLDREDLLNKAKEYEEAEKQCRIKLAADWKKGEREDLRALQLTWNTGGPHGRTSVVLLRPGKEVVRPLWQAQVWFGPFALWYDYKRAVDERDEKRRKFLYDKYHAERGRILDQYGYPPISRRGYQPDMQPGGPHRFPDVTVTVIDPEGNDYPESLRLHEVYKIGAWDVSYPLDSFGKKETAEEVEARLTAESVAQAETFKLAMQKRDEQFAEMKGLIAGLATNIPSRGSAKAGAGAGA
jgi:hypothetical protein